MASADVSSGEAAPPQGLQGLHGLAGFLGAAWIARVCSPSSWPHRGYTGCRLSWRRTDCTDCSPSSWPHRDCKDCRLSWHRMDYTDCKDFSKLPAAIGAPCRPLNSWPARRHRTDCMGCTGLQAFFAPQGLHGLQAFFLAAQGLHGLHAFLAPHGLQGLHPFFFAAQGLHGLHALLGATRVTRIAAFLFCRTRIARIARLLGATWIAGIAAPFLRAAGRHMVAVRLHRRLRLSSGITGQGAGRRKRHIRQSDRAARCQGRADKELNDRGREQLTLMELSRGGLLLMTKYSRRYSGPPARPTRITMAQLYVSRMSWPFTNTASLALLRP